MPALSFPVPQYTVLGTIGGLGIKRQLDDTSPGTTDNTGTATPGVSLLGPFAGYISPQTTAVSGSLLAVGTAYGRGWGAIPTTAGIIPNESDGYAVASGTLSVVIHASRAGGLLTGNHTADFTVIVFRSNSDATAWPQELGRATITGRSITTTEAAHAVNVSISSAEFAPGQMLWVEIYIDSTSAGTAGDACRIHTNSTTATRITAAPNYTIVRASPFAGAGAATPVAVGASRGAGVFAGAGGTASDWRQTDILSGVCAASGAADAEAIGTGIFSGAFEASASSEAEAVATAIFSGAFEAAGASASDWVAASYWSGVFAGAGETAGEFSGGSVAGTVFSAQGAADSDWRQTNLFSGVFEASGEAITYAPVTAIFSGVFDTAGSSAADAVGTGIFSGIFEADSAVTADYRGSSVAGTVFEANGAAATDIRLSVVLGAVFEADVSQGGGETVIVRRPIYLFDD